MNGAPIMHTTMHPTMHTTLRRPSPRAPLAALIGALVAVFFAYPVAQAAPGELELSVGPELLRMTDTRAFPLIDSTEATALAVRAGVGVHDLVDVFVGYRGATALDRRGADGVRYTTDLHGILGGVRARLPLSGGWLYAWGQVDLEANLARLALTIPGASGRQSAWSFGAVPQAGLEADLALGESGPTLLLRIGAGWALRLAHRFDAVPLDLDAPSVRPVDLGRASFSGFVLATTLGVRF